MRNEELKEELASLRQMVVFNNFCSKLVRSTKINDGSRFVSLRKRPSTTAALTTKKFWKAFCSFRSFNFAGGGIDHGVATQSVRNRQNRFSGR